MKIYIKNMVSLRCKMLVHQELEKLGLQHYNVELGEVELINELSGKKKKTQLKEALLKSELELMDDDRAILIEKIKNVIIEMVHYSEEVPKTNFSDFLSKALNEDYAMMSRIFSQTKGITIEHFIILNKIERPKELIIYDKTDK